MATSERLEVDPAKHRWLACLPLSHIGGLSVVTRSVLTGAELSVLDGFDAAAVAAAAGPEVLVSLVPTALARINPALFYRVLLGGSEPPPSLAPNVVTTYGMTETGSGVVYDGVPLRGVEISISGSGEIAAPLPHAPTCLPGRDGACRRGRMVPDRRRRRTRCAGPAAGPRAAF